MGWFKIYSLCNTLYCSQLVTLQTLQLMLSAGFCRQPNLPTLPNWNVFCQWKIFLPSVACNMITPENVLMMAFKKTCYNSGCLKTAFYRIKHLLIGFPPCFRQYVSIYKLFFVRFLLREGSGYQIGWILGKVSKGGGGGGVISNPKNLFCRFWEL